MNKIEAREFLVVDNGFGAWDMRCMGHTWAFDLGQAQAERMMNVCSVMELKRVTVLRNVRMIKLRMQNALRRSGTKEMKELVAMLGVDLEARLLFQKPWKEKPRQRKGIRRLKTVHGKKGWIK